MFRLVDTYLPDSYEGPYDPNDYERQQEAPFAEVQGSLFEEERWMIDHPETRRNRPSNPCVRGGHGHNKYKQAVNNLITTGYLPNLDNPNIAE